KKGVHGVVKLSIHVDEKGRVTEVVVVENTTGSEKCAQAAVDAAYGSRFYPAKEGNKAVSFWISQPYRFDLRK
ncbi:MAG: TonB family protein, partial [Calditrichaeota bacterium]